VLTLPPGVTVLDAGGGTASGDTLSWSLGTRDAGDVGERAVHLRFVVRVSSATPAGCLFSATSRVEDAAGSRAPASLATPVEPAS
jgi:hypothetical protein